MFRHNLTREAVATIDDLDLAALSEVPVNSGRI